MTNSLTRWAVALIVVGSMASAAHAAIKDVECYCTDKTGNRVELGEVHCMDVGGRVFAARCEMALNNPFWREIEGGCLYS